MSHAVSLAAVLFGLWLLLSGHYTPLLLGIGAAAAALSVVVAMRMDVVDHEGHPVEMWPRIVAYWAWLLAEIVRANVDVSRRVLTPSLPIEPVLFEVQATQQSDLAQVVYANSITLTPGTVTVAAENGVFAVHALSRNAADDIRGGAMDRRVTALEQRR